jgi:hypothetical protein
MGDFCYANHNDRQVHRCYAEHNADSELLAN